MPEPPKPSPNEVQGAPRVTSVPVQATAVAQQVHTAVTQLNTVSGWAAYTVALNNLRHNAAEAAPLIAQLYHAAPEVGYLDRWSLVKVLADLQRPDSLNQLAAIVATPLPKAQGPGAERQLSEETMIPPPKVSRRRRAQATLPRSHWC